MQDKRNKKIALLMGGHSAEREISLLSGKECSAALRTLGYDICEIDAARHDMLCQLKNSAFDVVFNALHGRGGEDGTIQGVLEWLGIAYTHSGVTASALAMDKNKAKMCFRDAGLRVPYHKLITKKDILKYGHPIDCPYVIKPVNEGSSIGVFLIKDSSRDVCELADDIPDELMVEKFIEGHELTVSVLGDRALGVTEIVTDDWYDYRAKYTQGGSRHILPADIPSHIADAACRDALLAHNALGCRGLTRCDFRWMAEKDVDGLFLLEINTQPGMTCVSLSPEQAALAGLDFPHLCEWIVKDASCNR